ncbi:MAG: alpha-hydroxy acid oxidase [Pseudolabrys sp.]|nr:alpha-hydroxy acid oxidase [Pseudolabrys sp.]
MSVEQAINIEDLRRMCRRRLPRIAFDYIEGGTEDERGMPTNTAGFLRYRLLPRYLVDVSKREQSVTLFGKAYSSPFGFGPTGTMGLFRRGSELMLAEAARDANIPYVMSGASNASMEAAARIAPDHLWYQLYSATDQGICADLLRRAHNAGIGVLMVTVDVPVRTRRERNIRNGFNFQHKLKPSIVAEALRHPAWIVEYLRHGGAPILDNWAPYAAKGANATEVAQFFNSQVPAPSQTWRELDTFRKLWPGKLVVKGVMTTGDAERAVAAGADGILVSNHGGRQLDRAPAPIDMFPAIDAAVGDKVTLMLDSGIRRGSDIITALCVGAKFTFLGRAGLYGVSAGGLAGAKRVIEIFRTELDLTMGQMGCPTVADLGPECLWTERDLAPVVTRPRG